MSTLPLVIVLESVYSFSGPETRQIVELRAYATIFMFSCLIVVSQ
jgi:hypothetical protein